MKEFASLHFDVVRCRAELDDFADLLSSRRPLSERIDILPFFRQRAHLAAFAASHHTHTIGRDPLIAFEFPLFGDLAADLVVGNSTRSTFCFIEFEDATPGSTFRPAGRMVPAWSPRFTGGFFQVVDWFWKLAEFQHTPEFSRTFNSHVPDLLGMVVAGRSHDLSEREMHRLQWLRQNVVVNSRHVYCCTFDELYLNVRERFDIVWGASRADSGGP